MLDKQSLKCAAIYVKLCIHNIIYKLNIYTHIHAVRCLELYLETLTVVISEKSGVIFTFCLYFSESFEFLYEHLLCS